MRVGLISLGCAKNLVDAEIMLGSLLKDGIQITNDAAQADALIVNTCSFIDSAQEESVDAILESAEVRNAKNRGQSLIVSGCLPQRFRDELPKLLPEVDAFMGIDQVAQVSEIVKGAIKKRGERIGKTAIKKNEVKRKASKAKIVERFAELENNHRDERGRDQRVVSVQRPRFYELSGAVLPDHGAIKFKPLAESRLGRRKRLAAAGRFAKIASIHWSSYQFCL